MSQSVPKRVGSPKCPLTETVVDLVSTLAIKIGDVLGKRSTLHTLEALIAFHNMFACFTVIFMAYALGSRAVCGPLLLPMIDPDDGKESENRGKKTSSSSRSRKKLQPEYCTVSDKDTVDRYHTRLVYIEERLRRHLLHYNQYLNLFLKSHKGKNKDLLKLVGRTFFFLRIKNGKLTAEEVTPKALSEELEAHGYYVASNANRVYLKSRWFEIDGAHDVIELFLGHWSRGLEGFTRSSSLHPADYRDELKTHLKRLLDELELRPLKGPKVLKIRFVVDKVKLARTERTKRNIRPHFDPQTLPGSVWKDVLGKTFAQRDSIEGVFTKAQQEVLTLAEKYLPEIYRAEPKLTEKTTQQKIDKFYKKLSQKVDEPTAYKRKTFFYDVLERSIKLFQWRLSLPTKPVVTGLEKNLLRPNMIEDFILYHRLEQAISDDLEKGLPRSVSERVGQVILSAILYGGLLHRLWVKTLPQALARSLYQVDQCLWLDLWQIPIPRNSFNRFREQLFPSQYRRWVADITTQFLIYRLLESYPSRRFASINAEQALMGYVEKRLGFYGDNALSIKRLLRCAFAYSLTRLPPFLVAYGSNRLTSASLPDERWLSALIGRIVMVRRPWDNSGRVRPRAMRINCYLHSHQDDLRNELLEFLSKACINKNISEEKLRAERVSEIEGLLEKHGDLLSPVLQLLGFYSVYLLSTKDFVLGPRCVIRPLKLSTVQEYVSGISSMLLKVFRDINPVEMEPEDLNYSFKQLINMIDSSNKKRLSGSELSDENIIRTERHLIRFYKYLEFDHGAPPCPLIRIDENREEKLLNAKYGVSANLFSEEDYQRILRGLGWGTPQLTRVERIMVCIVIFGQHLGHRASEILGLRIKDIQEGCWPIAQIRAHKGRRIKSPSSERDHNLKYYLSEEEFSFFWAWFEQREREATKGNEYLFTLTELNSEMLSSNEAIAPLRKIIKHVTGDEMAVFHHTRHSFDTSLVTRLLLRDDITYDSLPHFIDSLPHLKDRLRSDIEQNRVTGHTMLLTVAIIMGHSDVPIGMHSYFHLCDWFLSYFTRHEIAAPGLSQRAWRTILGVNENEMTNITRSESFPYSSQLQRQCDSFSFKLAHPLLETALESPPEWNRSEPNHGRMLFDCAMTTLLYGTDSINCELSFPKEITDRGKLQAMYERLVLFPTTTLNRLLDAGRRISAGNEKGQVRLFTAQELREGYEFWAACGIDKESLRYTYLPKVGADEDQKVAGWMRWSIRFPDLSIPISASETTEERFGCLVVETETDCSVRSPFHWIPVLLELFQVQKLSRTKP